MRRKMQDENGGVQLLCDEDPFVSSPSPSPSMAITRTRQCGCCFCPWKNHACLEAITVEEEQELVDVIRLYKIRERRCAPRSEYFERLRGSLDLSSARSTGIRYIIYACGRLDMAAGTVFNAANYLDRFLSMNCHVKWEVWMVELLSIACLSVACKLDEVNVPSLHDLQMEELRYSFQPTTIQEMELTLLKALDWRLSCVTPRTFAELFPPNLAARATGLLLGSLLDPSFLRFDASTIAMSALRCVVEDHEGCSRLLDRLIPICHIEDVEACLKIMETHDMSSHCDQNHRTNQWSPVSVIPAVSRRLIG